MAGEQGLPVCYKQWVKIRKMQLELLLGHADSLGGWRLKACEADVPQAAALDATASVPLPLPAMPASPAKPRLFT